MFTIIVSCFDEVPFLVMSITEGGLLFVGKIIEVAVYNGSNFDRRKVMRLFFSLIPTI